MIQTSTIERWLGEDIGHHDVTNQLPGETNGRLVAKADGVVAGLDASMAVFDYLDVATETCVDVGDQIEAGDVVLHIDGPTRETLRGERVAVNLAGHASGIATLTRKAVDAAREMNDDVRISATRKTTPGLRGIEKRAVTAGGGDTHRLTLSHMVMVKDNHIQKMGLECAVEYFRERVSFTTKIEVEVEQPEEARKAADAGADIVLLDNMQPVEIEQALERLPDGILTEASGGITVDNVSEYAATDVDIISLGQLTHSAPALDFSFQLE